MPKNATHVLLDKKMEEIRAMFKKLKKQNESLKRQMQKQDKDQQQARQQRSRLAKSNRP